MVQMLIKADTDEDDLTDYQEIYLTGTDPLKFDSVTDGVSDAEADSDSDGLSNKQEIEIGTNPKKSDTDDDRLSDGDEVNIYGTDPLKADTDEDGLRMEMSHILDLIQQILKHLVCLMLNIRLLRIFLPIVLFKKKKKKKKKKINTAESPYKLSIDITAAGYVEGNLTAKKQAILKQFRMIQCLALKTGIDLYKRRQY